MNDTLRVIQRQKTAGESWTRATVFVVRWQSGLFGHDLVGVFANATDADAAFTRRQAIGHGGAKSEPTVQDRGACIVSRAACVQNDEFLPVGSWFDDSVEDLVFHAGLGETWVPTDNLIFTFGNAPDEIRA